MSQLPLVSAIIATYNRAYIVHEAIDSILAQTYKNAEIIVVDDGSTDDTQEKLKKYGDRIRTLHQPNSGPAAAWNAGIKASRGSIICFLGSDDVWLPTFVERQVGILDKAGPTVPCSLTNAITRWADGRETTSFELAALRPRSGEGLWLNVLDVLLTRFVMCGQMFAIRRRALDRIGYFDPALIYLEDYDIALRLSIEGAWGFVREPLVVFRQSTRGDSMSLSISPENPVLHENILRTRQRVRHLMETRQPPVRSRRMAFAIQKANHDLWLARLRQSGSPLRGFMARAYKVAEHYGEAVYDRSPFFPQMKVAAL